MKLSYKQIEGELKKGVPFGYAGTLSVPYDYYTISDGLLKGIYSCDDEKHEINFIDAYKMISNKEWHRL